MLKRVTAIIFSLFINSLCIYLFQTESKKKPCALIRRASSCSPFKITLRQTRRAGQQEAVAGDTGDLAGGADVGGCNAELASQRAVQL